LKFKKIFFLLVVFLVGCSFRIDQEGIPNNHLKIELNEVPANINKVFQQLLFNPNLNSQIQTYVAPSAISDFNCFMANVTGPGIANQPTYVDECTMRITQGRPVGATSLLFLRGQSADVVVPPSSDLIVDIYGLYPSIYPYCTSTQANSGSIGYLLGSRAIKLSGDSQGLVIPISYVSGTAATLYCNNPPEIFDVQPRLTLAGGGENFKVTGKNLNRMSQINLNPSGPSTTTLSYNGSTELTFTFGGGTPNTYVMVGTSDDSQSVTFGQNIVLASGGVAYVYITNFTQPPNTTTSSTSTVTLRNSGPLAATSGTFSFTPNVGVFSITNSCTNLIGTVSTCNETLTFSPLAGDPVGTKYNATLTITYTPAHASVPNSHSVQITATKF
jgi:hypothetical protein